MPVRRVITPKKQRRTSCRTEQDDDFIDDSELFNYQDQQEDHAPFTSTSHHRNKSSKKKKESSEDELFEVVRVINDRVRNGKQELLVRWKDCESDEDSWEPFDEINRDCQELIVAYWKSKSPSAKQFEHKKIPSRSRQRSQSPTSSVLFLDVSSHSDRHKKHNVRQEGKQVRRSRKDASPEVMVVSDSDEEPVAPQRANDTVKSVQKSSVSEADIEGNFEGSDEEKAEAGAASSRQTKPTQSPYSRLGNPEKKAGDKKSKSNVGMPKKKRPNEVGGGEERKERLNCYEKLGFVTHETYRGPQSFEEMEQLEKATTAKQTTSKKCRSSKWPVNVSEDEDLEPILSKKQTKSICRLVFSDSDDDLSLLGKSKVSPSESLKQPTIQSRSKKFVKTASIVEETPTNDEEAAGTSAHLYASSRRNSSESLTLFTPKLSCKKSNSHIASKEPSVAHERVSHSPEVPLPQTSPHRNPTTFKATGLVDGKRSQTIPRECNMICDETDPPGHPNASEIQVSYRVNGPEMKGQKFLLKFIGEDGYRLASFEDLQGKYLLAFLVHAEKNLLSPPPFFKKLPQYQHLIPG